LKLGTPAEVLSGPAKFVAGFVGVNWCPVEASRRPPLSVRPEKIRLAAPDAATPPGYCRAPGRIRDVVYLGMHTRYLVELDAGGDLTVVEQNLATTSMDVLAARGRAVVLLWEAAMNRPIETAAKDQPLKGAPADQPVKAA
jgi:putative spermidine/putrescine transport system ATP-binding protein